MAPCRRRSRKSIWPLVAVTSAAVSLTLPVMAGGSPAKTAPAAKQVLDAWDLGNAALTKKLALAYLKQHPHDWTVREVLYQAEARTDPAQALRECQAACAIYPDDAQGYAVLGVLLNDQEKGLTARQAFQKAVKLAPDNADYWYLLGYNEHCIGQLANAEKAYEKSIKLKPAVRTYVMLTQLRMRSDPLAALAYAVKTIDLNPSSSAGWGVAQTALGTAFDRKILTAAACLDKMRQMQAKHPSESEGYRALYNTTCKWGSKKQAELVLKEGVNRLHSTSLAILLAGRLARSGQTKAARALLDKQVHGKRVSFIDYTRLGFVMEDLDDLKGAQKIFQHAVELRPDDPVCASELASIWYHNGDKEKALKEFARLHKLWPDTCAVSCSYVDCLVAAGDLTTALDVAKECTKRNPGEPDAWGAYGNVLFHDNQLAQSETAFRHLVRLVPNSGGARLELGMALLAEGKNDEALACFKQAVQWMPDYGTAFVYLGKCYARQGNRAQAEVALKKAVQLDPHEAKGWYQLGILLKQEGKGNEAAVAFEQASKGGYHSVEEMESIAYELDSLGRHKAATDLYREGLRLDAGEAEMMLNLPNK